MGAKEPKDVKQTNSVQLSPEQQQVFELAFPSVEKYASATPQIFNGTTVADFTSPEIQGQQALLQAAQGQVSQLAGAGSTANQFLMDPAILSPDSNPFLKSYGDNLTRTITDNLMQNILPGINRESVVAGGPYSAATTRPAIAEGLAIQGTGREIAGGLSSLYSNAYGQGLDALKSGIQLNPQTMASQLVGGSVQGAVGAQQRAMEQAKLNEQVQKFYLQQNLPFLKAQDLFSLISAMPGGQGVSTVSGAQPGKSPAMGALGGAASGAAIGSAIPGVGTAIGAGLGGLAGLFL